MRDIFPTSPPATDSSGALTGSPPTAGRRRFLEFFAGIGLISEAIAPLGWQGVMANDNDERKMATYVLNHPTTPVKVCDVRNLLNREIPDAELATASFPCIDLSQAGDRRGIDGEHSGVVWSFLDHIRSMVEYGRPPKFLFLENVAFLLTLHGGKSIDSLLQEIARLGYSIDLIQVDAQHFTPQTRNRVFIIGVRDGGKSSTKVMPEAHIRRYRVRDVYLRNRDLPWHFFDFPALPSRTLELADVIEDLPSDDPRWWDAGRTEDFWRQLEIHHRPQLEAIAASGADTHMTAVRRLRRRGKREQIFNLRFDGLASCLRTPRGGSSIQFVVQVRRGQVRIRRILGIESARLQGVGVPGSSAHFKLPTSEQDALFAFGDAVCVPAVRWVFEHSIQTLMVPREVMPQTQLQIELDAVS